MTTLRVIYDYSTVDLWLLYGWSMITLWLIYHYKLQSYDSGVASIFHMPFKDALQDNLSTSANQVSTEDNLLATAITRSKSCSSIAKTTRSLKNDCATKKWLKNNCTVGSSGCEMVTWNFVTADVGSVSGLENISF
jgi:hypothetical protein